MCCRILKQDIKTVFFYSVFPFSEASVENGQDSNTAAYRVESSSREINSADERAGPVADVRKLK